MNPHIDRQLLKNVFILKSINYYYCSQCQYTTSFPSPFSLQVISVWYRYRIQRNQANSFY